MTKQTPAEERDRYLDLLREIYASNAYTGSLPGHIVRALAAIVEGAS